MRVKKRSIKHINSEAWIMMFPFLYLFLLIVGFFVTWDGLKHNNMILEKSGNLIITTISVGVTVTMVFFIALQTKATKDMAEKTSARVQLTYDMVKQSSHQVSIMNESLVEMRKERMNIDFLVQYTIGYFKKIVEILNQNDRRLQDPKAIKSGSLKLSKLTEIESFVETDFREAKKRSMDPILFSKIGPYDSAYEVGMKYRIARAINKILERYGIDIGGYNALIEFDFSSSNLEDVVRRCEQIQEKGKEVLEKITRLLNNEDHLDEELLKR